MTKAKDEKRSYISQSVDTLPKGLKSKTPLIK